MPASVTDAQRLAKPPGVAAAAARRGMGERFPQPIGGRWLKMNCTCEPKLQVSEPL
jgi:hypothetical protein